ncbi:MAG: hypothetical protein IAE83_13670 [Anaerolinea sp.]|nr:hypothetical protein [Anaerolinea sp.]
MKLRKIAALVIVLLLTVSAIHLQTQPTQAQPAYRCFPTCDETDGKFLLLAGTNLNTLVGGVTEILLAAPAGSPGFNFGIFDGEAIDTSGTDPVADSFWDAVTGPAGGPYNWLDIVFEIYADPLADGTGMTLLTTLNGATMTNDDWDDFFIANNPLATAPSGNFFYRVLIYSPNPNQPGAVNQFKIRTDNYLALQASAFQIIGGSLNGSDLPLLYPNFFPPLYSLVPTTYDGIWDMYLDVFDPGTELVIWDGDFDYGGVRVDDLATFIATELTRDIDDPDTSNVGVPPWATGTDAVPEGVAVGATYPGPAGTTIVTTGAPNDDLDYRFDMPAPLPPNLFRVYLRAPSVEYSLIAPGGATYLNANPSGNQEWEQFRLSTDPFNPATMDYSVPVIPAGIWNLRVNGLDLSNLNALRLFTRIVCVQETGLVCDNILRPFLVGDRVWVDTNLDGIQDPGEPGIPGVTVELVNTAGQVIGTTTTGADGLYQFPVERGTYTVRVVTSSAPLANYYNTTPTQLTNTVVNTNILTYDFGFAPTYVIGDRVWEDYDGDGVQDPGEPGISFVQVQILDNLGNVIGTAETGADGIYNFRVRPGTYTVVVVTSSPALTDMLATTSTSLTFTVTNADVLTYDFGFRLPGGRRSTPTPGTPLTTLPSTGYPPAPDGVLPWGAALVIGAALVAGSVLLRIRRR